MRTLDRELEKAAKGLKEASRRIPDRAWTTGEPRRWPRALTPVMAAVAVMIVIGIPAFLLGGEDTGAVGLEPPTQEESFNTNLHGWTLIAVLRLQDELDVGVYRGPLPGADGRVTWIGGDREYWPPRDRDGDPLLLFDENSDPVELSDRPYALVTIDHSVVAVADPKDLLDGSKVDGLNLLERASRIDVAHPTAWHDFRLEAGRDR